VVVGVVFVVVVEFIDDVMICWIDWLLMMSSIDSSILLKHRL